MKVLTFHHWYLNTILKDIITGRLQIHAKHMNTIMIHIHTIELAIYPPNIVISITSQYKHIVYESHSSNLISYITIC